MSQQNKVSVRGNKVLTHNNKIATGCGVVTCSCKEGTCCFNSDSTMDITLTFSFRATKNDGCFGRIVTTLRSYSGTITITGIPITAPDAAPTACAFIFQKGSHNVPVGSTYTIGTATIDVTKDGSDMDPDDVNISVGGGASGPTDWSLSLDIGFDVPADEGICNPPESYDLFTMGGGTTPSGANSIIYDPVDCFNASGHIDPALTGDYQNPGLSQNCSGNTGVWCLVEAIDSYSFTATIASACCNDGTEGTCVGKATSRTDGMCDCVTCGDCSFAPDSTLTLTWDAGIADDCYAPVNSGTTKTLTYIGNCQFQLTESTEDGSTTIYTATYTGGKWSVDILWGNGDVGNIEIGNTNSGLDGVAGDCSGADGEMDFDSTNTDACDPVSGTMAVTIVVTANSCSLDAP